MKDARSPKEWRESIFKDNISSRPTQLEANRQLRSRAGLQQNGKIKGNQNCGSQSLSAACLPLSLPTLRHTGAISPSPTIAILKRVIYHSFPWRHRRLVKPSDCLSKGVIITEQEAPKGEGPMTKWRKQGEGAQGTVGAPSFESAASWSVSLFKFNSPQGDQVLGNPVTLIILTRH